MNAGERVRGTNQKIQIHPPAYLHRWKTAQRARLDGPVRARARAGGPRDHACFVRRCAKAVGCRSRLLARCGGKPCRDGNLNVGQACGLDCFAPALPDVVLVPPHLREEEAASVPCRRFRPSLRCAYPCARRAKAAGKGAQRRAGSARRRQSIGVAGESSVDPRGARCFGGWDGQNQKDWRTRGH